MNMIQQISVFFSQITQSELSFHKPSRSTFVFLVQRNVLRQQTGNRLYLITPTIFSKSSSMNIIFYDSHLCFTKSLQIILQPPLPKMDIKWKKEIMNDRETFFRKYFVMQHVRSFNLVHLKYKLNEKEYSEIVNY